MVACTRYSEDEIQFLHVYYACVCPRWPPAIVALVCACLTIKSRGVTTPTGEICDMSARLAGDGADILIPGAAYVA